MHYRWVIFMTSTNTETLAGLTYLYDLYINEICKRRNIGWDEFKVLNQKYGILNTITKFSEEFNEWDIEDGMKYFDKYVFKDERNVYS